MHFTRSLLSVPVFSALVTLGAAIFASQAFVAQSQQAEAAMTNSDVLALTAAGLAPDIIIKKITSAPGKSFDTSVETLKALKQAGVSSDVIIVMVNGGVPVTAATSTGGIQEPVFKEGLWQESMTSTMPGQADAPRITYRCHSHARDHQDFQKLISGPGTGPRTQKKLYEHKGMRTIAPDSDLEENCKVTRTSVTDGKQILQQSCQAHGMTVISDLSWKAIDEDHYHADAIISYTPAPRPGMDKVTMFTEMVFQRQACPSGMAPGESLEAVEMPKDFKPL